MWERFCNVGVIGRYEVQKGHLVALKNLENLTLHREEETFLKICDCIGELSKEEAIEVYCTPRELGSELTYLLIMKDLFKDESSWIQFRGPVRSNIVGASMVQG